MIKEKSIRGAGWPLLLGLLELLGWRPATCQGPYCDPESLPKLLGPCAMKARRASPLPHFCSFPQPTVPRCVTLSKLLTPANLSGFICEMDPVYFASQPWEAPHEKYQASLQLWTPCFSDPICFSASSRRLNVGAHPLAPPARLCPGLAVLLRLPWGWRPPASLESGWDSAHAFLWLPQQLTQGWAHRETVYLTDGEVAEREPRSLPAGAQPLVGQAASLGSRCDQPALVSDPRRIAAGLNFPSTR